MARQIIHTDAAPKAIGTYSQAVRCGATVYLAGQIGLDPATMEMVAGVGPQIHRVFQNLQAVAQAAGGDLKDVGQAHRLSHRSRQLRAGERDHGDLFLAALPRARRGRRRQPAARGAGGDRRHHASRVRRDGVSE